MKQDYHIDMSNRIFKNKTIGIACVSADKRDHIGCALKGNLIEFVKSKLYVKELKEEYAKLYAICIYFLVKDKVKDISTLIICNDEDFSYVKKFLLVLLGKESSRFEIINISEFRRKLGRKVGSIADNLAECYRKRALNPNHWNEGKELHIVEIKYKMIEEKWKGLSIT